MPTVSRAGCKLMHHLDANSFGVISECLVLVKTANNLCPLTWTLDIRADKIVLVENMGDTKMGETIRDPSFESRTRSQGKLVRFSPPFPSEGQHSTGNSSYISFVLLFGWLLIFCFDHNDCQEWPSLYRICHCCLVDWWFVVSIMITCQDWLFLSI